MVGLPETGTLLAVVQCQTRSYTGVLISP